MCEEVLAHGWHPDPVYVIDIVEDNNGKFWLMELNSFSSAGLYACDKQAIVREVSAIATEEFTNIQQLRQSMRENGANKGIDKTSIPS